MSLDRVWRLKICPPDSGDGPVDEAFALDRQPANREDCVVPESGGHVDGIGVRESAERGLRSAALGHERAEIAPPVVSQYDRLAVDQRAVAGEAANRLGNRREPIADALALA